MSEMTLFDLPEISKRGAVERFEWSQEEITLLIQLHSRNASRDEMQRALSRPYGSISGKLDRLGIRSRALPWKSEKVSMLIEMFAKNKSYSEIAEAVGTTRGAIAGKINRLRTKEKAIALTPREKPKKARSFRLPTQRVAPRDTAGRMEYKRLLNAGLIEARGARAAAVKEDDFTAAELRKSFVELESHECRWPYGDSDFTFCAKPATGSYCQFHTLVHRYGSKAAKSLYCEAIV